jgi:2-methylcitrate dehydratase
VSGLPSSQAPWIDDVAQCLLDAYANPIPDDVLERAAIQLFDMIACASGGFDAEPVRIAQAATAGSGPAEATVLFAGNRISALDAILVNGTAVRFLDYNDAFIGSGPGGHPSDNSVAALAVAEAEGAPGRDLLAAVVLGYELFWRFRQSVYAQSERGAPWDGVSVSAVVAAAMSGLLMGLDRKRLSHALSIGLAKGYALKQLRRGSISMIKASANALVARDGVLAAQMARHGLTGPGEILEGKSGVLHAFGVGTEPELRATLTAPPTWAIRNVSIKAYPAIATAQAAVEAAVRIAARANLASGVRTVEVRLPDSTATREHLDIEQRQRPDSRESADHSVPFLIAAALEDGRLSLAQFSDERWLAPGITALMERIRVIPDPDLVTIDQRSYPAVVTVELSDGRRLTESVMDVPGSPSSPWGFAEVEKKLAAVDRVGFSTVGRADLASAAAALPRASDVTELLGAATVRARSIQKETVGAAPGERT